MTKTREFIDDEKQRMISLHQTSLGYENRNAIRKFLCTGTMSNKPRTGRTKVTTSHVDRLIVRQMLTDCVFQHQKLIHNWEEVMASLLATQMSEEESKIENTMVE